MLNGKQKDLTSYSCKINQKMSLIINNKQKPWLQSFEIKKKLTVLTGTDIQQP